MTINEPELSEVVCRVYDEAGCAAVPVITKEEVDQIVRGTARSVPWEPRTYYRVGQMVASGQGSVYRVVRAGVTGATPPAWPVPSCLCSGILDEGAPAPVYRYVGPDLGPWNESLAVFRVWKRKLALATELVATSSAGQSTQAQMVWEHCKQMCAITQPWGVA